MIALLIKACTGYELEKELPNTPEDYFNKSEVIFEEEGIEKKLTILYLRYFEEKMQEFTPFEGNPLFQVGSRSIEFKDIVAIMCLIRNPHYKNRKRVYINAQTEFAPLFHEVGFDKLKAIFQSLLDNNGCELPSPEEFNVHS